jgi:hypothetical protein
MTHDLLSNMDALTQQFLTEQADRFAALMVGSDKAHGEWTFTGTTDDKGKVGADNKTLTGPLTRTLIEQHLRGEKGVGVIPIRADGRCRIGVVDYDTYDSTAYGIALEKAQCLRLPMVPVKSKSGGLQLWLFLEDWTPAQDVRAFLQRVAEVLGMVTEDRATAQMRKDTDIFPAQDAPTEKDGNWIRLPYFNGLDYEKTRIHAYHANGRAMTLSEFVAAAQPIRSFELVEVEAPQTRDDLPTDDATAIFEAAGIPEDKRSAVKGEQRHRKLYWAGRLWNAGYDGEMLRGAMLTLTCAATVDRDEKSTEAICKYFQKRNFARPVTFDVPLPEARDFPKLDARALYGLPGEFVRLVAKHTEADTAAVLAQMLIAYGNLVSTKPYVWTDANKQRTNEYVLIVGDSAVGRKQVGASVANFATHNFDEEWQRRKDTGNGFGSGEAIIATLADYASDKMPGTPDKRLVIQEGEFAGILTVANRPGSVLGAILRNAWDCRPLSNNTKEGVLKSLQLRVSEPRISLSAHITKEELKKLLRPVDIDNGFMNRMLVICSRRSQVLPRSTLHTVDFAPIQNKIRGVYHAALRIEEMVWSAAAAAAFDSLYYYFAENVHRGMLAKLCTRAEAHIVRLSMIYALFDGSATIRYQHLAAACALWQYVEDSMFYIYGDTTSAYADLIVSMIRVKGPMSREDTFKEFDKFMPRMDIKTTVDSLVESGQLISVKEPTRTKPKNMLHTAGGATRRNILQFFQEDVVDETVERPMPLKENFDNTAF